MTVVGSGFDRVATWYQPLEYLAFGRTLERARGHALPRLAACRDVVVLGDGDGRGLTALLRAAPQAQVRCVESSRAMIALATRRLAAAGLLDRVSFEARDVRDAEFPIGSCDAVVTTFFLDCFSPADVVALAARLSRSLRAGGLWLFADFAIPSRGLARWRARAIVRGLYAFFRWRTGLDVSALPPSETIIGRTGLRAIDVREYEHGLIRSVLFGGIDTAASRS
jgi:SAM-dependent methyltransferase